MKILVSKTYETFTEESVERGDAEERGFVFEDEVWDLDDVIRELQNEGYYHLSDSKEHVTGRTWVTTENDIDYKTGIETCYSLFLRRVGITGKNYDEALLPDWLINGIYRKAGIINR
jgi:hypothetical protein